MNKRRYLKSVLFSELLGLTIDKIVGLENDSGEVFFYSSDGRKFLMFHSQDCCEDVAINEIHGDVEDLISSPILRAEEVTNAEGPTPEGYLWDDAYEWTFYKLATIKGEVVIRWLGTSNGYYSTDVSFREVFDV